MMRKCTFCVYLMDLVCLVNDKEEEEKEKEKVMFKFEINKDHVLHVLIFS